MTAAYRARQTFDMGRVIERTFGAVGANGLILVPIAIAVVGAPQAITALVATGRTAADDWTGMIGLGSIALVLGIAGNIVMQGVTTYAVVADLRGRRAGFGEALAAALGSFWVLLALGIVVGLATLLGMIVLIVPGVIVALAWSLVGPVAVAEKAGVGRALSRSRDLTRNHRWAILGLMVVYAIAGWVFRMVAGSIATVVMTTVGIGDTVMWTLVVLTPILQALLSILGSAGIAAIYVELRQVKEGGEEQNLAAIFD